MPWNDLVLVGLAAFGISVVLTPIFRDIFRSYKIVDQPDRKRKVHVYPIPRVGGIALVIAYFCAFYFVRPGASSGWSADLSIVSKVVPAGLLVFATGLIDDFLSLKPWQKFIGQFGAAFLAWWAGVQIQGVGGTTFDSLWSLPLTVLWLVLCTNAFNLVDGLDGLAAGAGLFATITIFTAAVLHGNEPLAYATIPLAGCLVGFLCFNFNPATVFLGDCGSLLIGFLLGCYGVIWSQKSLTLLGLAAPLMAVSVPLIDVLLCVIRRWLRNQPIFSADRGHIHHKLLDRGLSPRQAVFLLYGLCGIAAAFSLLQSIVDNAYASGIVIVGFITVVWFGVHQLRYTEFMLAGRILRLTQFQRSMSANLSMSHVEAGIAEATTVEECWDALLTHQKTFGFSAMRLNIGGTVLENWPIPVDSPRHWYMRVPVSNRGDYFELARETGSQVVPSAVVPFVDQIAAALTRKLNSRVVASSAAQARISMQPGN